MSQRSITPTSLKVFTPIQVEENHTIAERWAMTETISLLQQKQYEFQQTASDSIQSLKAATDGIVDHSRFARSETEFKDLDTEFGVKLTD